MKGIRMSTRREMAVVMMTCFIWATCMTVSFGAISPKEPNKSCGKNVPEKRRKTCDGLEFLAAAQDGRVHKIKELLLEPHSNYLLGYRESQGWRKGYTALVWAAEKNNSKIVKLLVDAGAKVSQESYAGYTAVFHLASHGNLESLDLLLSKEALADVTTKTGYTPLLMAAWNGHAKIVQILLEHNANPNHTTRYTEYFPLYFAAKLGDVDMVKSLIQANAYVNQETSIGVTSLATATAWKRDQVVQLLLNDIANPNLLDQLDTGPLHRAADFGYTNILKMLIKAKAEINVRNVDGKTPLSCSAVRGQTDTLKELLKSCPDSTIKDNKGKNALDATKAEKDKLMRKKARTSNDEDKIKKLEEVISILNDYNPVSCG